MSKNDERLDLIYFRSLMILCKQIADYVDIVQNTAKVQTEGILEPAHGWLDRDLL